MTWLKLILLFTVGITAGLINVMAGGGSSITLPALIFMGLDGSLANGTNRIAIIIQNIFAVSSFYKNKAHQFKKSMRLAVFTLPGAVAGALLAVRISDALFQRILGIILILVVFSMYISNFRRKKLPDQQSSYQWLIYPALFGIGFYGGFLQVGVGFLFMAALYHLLRHNLTLVNMHKVFIILVYTLPALFIFIYSGNVNWKFGLILAAGNAIGGWWGARITIRGGEKVIRIILAIAVVIMAFKLFGVY